MKYNFHFPTLCLSFCVHYCFHNIYKPTAVYGVNIKKIYSFSFYLHKFTFLLQFKDLEINKGHISEAFFFVLLYRTNFNTSTLLSETCSRCIVRIKLGEARNPNL